jgi:antitoxin CcdA
MADVEVRLKIDALLLEQARAANLPIGVLLERSLKQALGPAAAEIRAASWAAENKAAIEAHKRRIEEHGVFGEDLRRW